LIYYKKLNIKWKPVADQILEHINQDARLIKQGGGSWRLANWILDKTDIQSLFEWNIEFVGLFVTHNNKSSIHVDNDQKPVRINFPILNCEDTLTKYYKFDGATDFTTQKNGISYNNINSEDVVEVDNFKLDGAVLMRVLEPHQVCVNHNTFPRVSCTVQFKQNLEFLLNK
jgi:hypothetical protein